MGERKNIDRLFQEQLKNFEETPGDHVWENIREELENTQEPKKKVLPIWYRFAGIAASLILLISLVVNIWSDDIPDANTTIVNTESNSSRPSNDSKNNDLKDSSSSKNHELLKDKKDTNITSQSTNEAIVLEDSKKENKANNNILSNSEKNSDSYVNKNANELYKVNNDKTNLTPYNNQVVDQKEVLVKRNKTLKSKNATKSIVASNATVQENSKNSKNISSSKNNPEGYLVKEEQLNNPVTENGLVDNNVKSNNKEEYVEDERAGLLKSNKSQNKPIGTNKDNVVVANETEVKEGEENAAGKSLDNSIVDNNVINTEKLDTTFKDPNSSEDNAVAENNTKSNSELSKEDKKENEEEKEAEEKELQTIEEAIAEQENTEEEKDDEDAIKKKWQVRPNIAPVYYNSLSSGSPIDEQFKGNKKKGEVNMSYGVNVNYNLNKKLKLRTGVNKVELGYNTENVAVVPAGEGESIDFIRNVTMSSAASQLNISSADGFEVSQIPSSFRNLFDARISQKFGYIEVPLELSYQVSHKKISIDLIAGMSTFFLDKNEVHARTNSFTTYLGEANNLNKTSFSTNFGVGFNYQISKAFHLNVEPTFKYQLNSFSNDAGNFKPYLLGVYSGFSFKF